MLVADNFDPLPSVIVIIQNPNRFPPVPKLELLNFLKLLTFVVAFVLFLLLFFVCFFVFVLFFYGSFARIRWVF